MKRYAEVYGGKIRDIQESHLDYVDFISIFDPKSFWLDITGQEDIQVGDVQTFDPKGGIIFVHPEEPEVSTPEETLEELKARKVTEMKAIRDALEVEPIEVHGNLYDFDTISRERLDVAQKALSQMPEGSSIPWTTANGTTVAINMAILNAIFMCAAMRSNELHKCYRKVREAIDSVTTREELDNIEWPSKGDQTGS